VALTSTISNCDHSYLVFIFAQQWLPGFLRDPKGLGKRVCYLKYITKIVPYHHDSTHRTTQQKILSDTNWTGPLWRNLSTFVPSGIQLRRLWGRQIRTSDYLFLWTSRSQLVHRWWRHVGQDASFRGIPFELQQHCSSQRRAHLRSSNVWWTNADPYPYYCRRGLRRPRLSTVSFWLSATSLTVWLTISPKRWQWDLMAQRNKKQRQLDLPLYELGTWV
jgi:hypothetical protein